MLGSIPERQYRPSAAGPVTDRCVTRLFIGPLSESAPLAKPAWVRPCGGLSSVQRSWSLFRTVGELFFQPIAMGDVELLQLHETGKQLFGDA